MFLPCDSDWLPGNAVRAIVSDDFYVFGVLVSSCHRGWVQVQSSTLEDRTRYTHKTCFETFPFPQSALELHEYRSQEMGQRQWGITQLYNEFFDEPASQLAKLHAKLDKLVMQAYGFKDSDDILEKLLELNLELAEKEKNGEPVVGPWAPV